jgi:hypothetical protein
VSRLRFLEFALSLCLAASVAGPAAERWRFIMTCDSRGSVLTGINEEILVEMVDEILRWDVDFVLFAGDLVYGARVAPEWFEDQLWHWVYATQRLYDAGIAVYVCRGNHEVGDAWDIDWGIFPDPADNYALRWLNVFGSDAHPESRLPGNGPAGEKYMTYSVVHKNALIVALDQYAGMKHRLAHSLNQPWLDAQLEHNVKPHVFVFGHEPAFQALHPDGLGYHPEQRDIFWHSLKMAGARLYFCGHDHFYDHAVVDDGDDDPNNDIHQYIVGSAGATPYNWTPPYAGDNGAFEVSQIYHAEHYGYVVVEVNDLDVTLTWMERQDDDLPYLDDVHPPAVYRATEVWRYRASTNPMILQPNGGERVFAGRPYTIRWRTLEDTQTQRVLLEYSLDNGVAWARIDEVDNTGVYEWTPPVANSGACLLRLQDVHNPALRDTSDSPFAILTCQRQLAADVNGDCRVDFADLAILAAEWLACADPLDPACHPHP